MPSNLILVDHDNKRRRELALVLTSIGGYQIETYSVSSICSRSQNAEILLAPWDLHDSLDLPLADWVLWYGESPTMSECQSCYIHFNRHRPPEFAESVRQKIMQLRKK